jgi:hypothetical protein
MGFCAQTEAVGGRTAEVAGETMIDLLDLFLRTVPAVCLLAIMALPVVME